MTNMAIEQQWQIPVSGMAQTRVVVIGSKAGNGNTTDGSKGPNNNSMIKLRRLRVN
jgi:hypothetical protein